MTLKKLIRENREKLDRYIQRVAPGAPRNDNERRLWVLNDERLYKWARSCGVRI